MRVLVIEDDEELAEIVGATLRREQMAVDVAFDGATGLDRALEHDYDVVVLGWGVCGNVAALRAVEKG